MAPVPMTRAIVAGCIERSRELLGQELSALVGESYERAYQNMVRVQQLTELEETIEYSLAFQLAQGAALWLPYDSLCACDCSQT